MTAETFRWLATPGCGIAVLLLVYDARRALQPRIAGERPWRETRAIGLITLILGMLLLQHLHGPAWLGAATEAILLLALGPLLWSSVSLTRLVAGVLREPVDE
jgi:hypothetical protein